MSKRKITNLFNVDFKPFDNYGVTVPGMSWHKISYDKQNGGYGTYILKMDPDAKSLHHVHTGYEEFLMMEGELTDEEKFDKIMNTQEYLTKDEYDAAINRALN